MKDELLVFISYRREDSAGHAGRLYDDLVRRFTAADVFFDVDTIPPGAEFPKAIRDAVGRCRALVALIGPRWLEAAAQDGSRRLDDPDDYVRLEIQAALERDVLVVPVLLQGARMPKARELPTELKALARRNAMQLRDASWRADFEALGAGLERLAAATGASGLRGDHEAFWTLPPADVELPFLGLRAFEEDDARFYFGREDDVAELLERLRRDRFLAVFGPSGSGKSSLVRAGLTRALREGALEGSADWPIETVRPGPHPLETLAAHLHRLNPRRPIGELVDALAADPRTLHLETFAALAGGKAGRRLVWIIDQAEELFTVCADEAERSSAIANIVHAASVEGGCCDVVFAMRADFFQRCAVYPELAAAVSRSPYLVSPMSEAAIRRAVEEPARQVGLSFEPGLVETILQDVAAQPGALPLLEHALFELFQRRRGTTLTLEGYRATGGVQGALARRAESVYDGLSETEQALVRRLMVRLTQPGEGAVDTRRRSPLSDLLARPADAGPINHLIDELASARLVTLGAGDDAGEPVVEIAHEALIRAWPRVRGWLEQDREALRVQRRIADAAAEWERLQRAPEALFRGVRLSEAQEWQGRNAEMLNASETAFLATSSEAAGREAAARDRQRRRFLFASVSIALFFVILSGLTFVAWRGSEDARAATAAALQRAEAEKKRADENVVQLELQRRIALGRGLVSEASRPETPFATGLLLGLEARRLAGPEANEYLVRRLSSWPQLVRTVPAPDLPPETQIAVSPDLSTLAYAEPATSAPEQQIFLRDLTNRSDRGLATMTSVFRLGFSPDGQTLLASGVTLDGRSGVLLLGLGGAAETFLDTGVPTALWSMSADGSRIVAERFVPAEAGGGSDALVVWDRGSAEPLLTVPVAAEAPSFVSLSRNGAWLAVESLANGGGDAAIDLWNVAKGSSRRILGGPPATSDGPTTADTAALWPSVAFSAEADRMAVVTKSLGGDPTVELWDAGSELRRIAQLPLTGFTQQSVALSADGMSFVLGGADSTGIIGVEWGSFVAVRDELSGQAAFLPSPFSLDSVHFGSEPESVVGENGLGEVAEWRRTLAPAPRASRQLDPVLAGARLSVVGPGGATAILDRFPDPEDPIGATITEIVDTSTGEHQPLSSPNRIPVAISADGRSMVLRTPTGVAIEKLTGIRSAPGVDIDTLFPNATEAVAISGDGSFVAIAAYDDTDASGPGPGSVELVDGIEGQVLGAKSFDGTPVAIAFAPGGATFALATIERSAVQEQGDPFTITIWDRATLAPLRVLARQSGSITSLAFSGDGARISATLAGWSVVTWSIETGLATSRSAMPEVVEGVPGGGSTSIASTQFRLAPDGDSVVTSGQAFWVWDLAAFDAPIEDRVCALANRNLTTAEWQRYLPGEGYAGTCFKSTF